MQLSVITPTCQRPALLGHALQQFRQQSLDGVRCEQIVVSDGPDPMARYLARRWNVRYFETEEHRGHAGAYARDRGILEARGDYVCFWDDDNLYDPHALATLFATASGVDIGVVRAHHRLRKKPGACILPRRWEGRFQAGDIDTMCVCVRRDLARLELWGDAAPFANSRSPHRPGTDIRWLRKLEAHHPRIRYVPIVIGIHL